MLAFHLCAVAKFNKMKNKNFKFKIGIIERTFVLVPTIVSIWSEKSLFETKKMTSIEIRWLIFGAGVLITRALANES
jgi:hypothetical protein